MEPNVYAKLHTPCLVFLDMLVETEQEFTVHYATLAIFQPHSHSTGIWWQNWSLTTKVTNVWASFWETNVIPNKSG
jgi:hypothetical protein